MSRIKLAILGLLLTTRALAETTPAGDMDNKTGVTDGQVQQCISSLQDLSAGAARAHGMVQAKNWKESITLNTTSQTELQHFIQQCPAQADQARVLEAQVNSELQQARDAVSRQHACDEAIDRGFDLDLQTSTARRENRDPRFLDKLLTGAESSWQSAVENCSGSYHDSAARSLRAAQQARKENAELLADSPVCENAYKNAVAIGDMARQAKKERRRDDSIMLFNKLHMAWSRVADNCSGPRNQTAQKEMQSSSLEASNAEFCAPQWEDAAEATQQLNRAKMSAAVYAEREELMNRVEVLWREAVDLCKGEPKNQARFNADSIAKERATPLPANAMADFGKHRALPPAAAPLEPAAAMAVTGTTAAASATASASPTAAPSKVIAKVMAKLTELSESQKKAAPEQKAAVAVSDNAPLTAVGDVKFRGDFRNDEGKVSGSGVMELPNGDIYRGRIVQGLRNGKGRLEWKNGQTYDGDWVNDHATGTAVIVFQNGNRYQGEVFDGVPQGQGEMDLKSGDRYVGHFEQGIFNGQGKYTWKSGAYYTGAWKDGKKSGFGKTILPNGFGFEGEYLDDSETANVKRIKPKS